MLFFSLLSFLCMNVARRYGKREERKRLLKKWCLCLHFLWQEIASLIWATTHGWSMHARCCSLSVYFTVTNWCALPGLVIHLSVKDKCVNNIITSKTQGNILNLVRHGIKQYSISFKYFQCLLDPVWNARWAGYGFVLKNISLVPLSQAQLKTWNDF